MTRDDIIRMARDAGAAKFYPIAQETKEDSYLVGVGFLERFAAIVAAAEREECAKVCVGLHVANTFTNALQCADAIRARQ